MLYKMPYYLQPLFRNPVEAIVTTCVIGVHLFVAVTCVAQLAERSWIPLKVGWPVVCSVLPLGYAITFLVLCAVPASTKWVVVGGTVDELVKTLHWKFVGLLCSLGLYIAMAVFVEVVLDHGLIVDGRLMNTSDPEADTVSGVVAATVVFRIIISLTLVGAAVNLALYTRNILKTLAAK